MQHPKAGSAPSTCTTISVHLQFGTLGCRKSLSKAHSRTSTHLQKLVGRQLSRFIRRGSAQLHPRPVFSHEYSLIFSALELRVERPIPANIYAGRGSVNHKKFLLASFT
eukprot:scaffold5024_cov136-Cylindrotheca_fusiformis.AAC.38